MLRESDGTAGADPRARRDWMQILAQAPVEMLERWRLQAAETGALPGHAWLRQPEIGLAMVRGRIGGAGERFNLGEMTVTRCALRIDSGEVGVAYVRGRSQRKAELAAFADALLQAAAWREAVRRGLIEPVRAYLQAESRRKQRKAQATRVEFFTLAREAGK